MPQEDKPVQDISGLTLQSLSFSCDRWKHEGKWTGTARLSKDRKNPYDGITELTIELDANVATAIIKLLSPVIVKSASERAQGLADQAKQLASDLGDKMLQIEAK